MQVCTTSPRSSSRDKLTFRHRISTVVFLPYIDFPLFSFVLGFQYMEGVGDLCCYVTISPVNSSRNKLTFIHRISPVVYLPCINLTSFQFVFYGKGGAELWVCTSSSLNSSRNKVAFAYLISTVV